MSEEIKGRYLASDSQGIHYELTIYQADDLPGFIKGLLFIDKDSYDVQGSYKFKDGKLTPANIQFKITPPQNLSSQSTQRSPSCGEFTLTSSETLTGNLFAESFKQLFGQGKLEDEKTGTTKIVENMIFKKESST